MKARLIHHTPLTIASNAIRTCWSSFDKSDSEEGSLGLKDKELIYRVGNQYKHASTLEHINYTFYLTISRAVLQELARHRIASLSVKSSRYTLTELKEEVTPFLRFSNCEKLNKALNWLRVHEGRFKPGEHETAIEQCDMIYNEANILRVEKYIVLTDNKIANYYLLLQLENLRCLVSSGISIDIAKYALPECYKTELTWTVNARSLQNFLALRTNKSALWEIRQLAYDVYQVLPEDHKYLFEEFLYKEKGVDSGTK